MSEPFIQLLSLGPLWVIFHCSGMCGTLLTGLDLSGLASGGDMASAIKRILQYQFGRAMVYCSMGLVAGLFGDAWARVGESATGTLALGVGLFILVYSVLNGISPMKGSSGLVQLGVKSKRPSRLAEQFQSTIAQLVPLATLRKQPIALGMMMAFLPCMLPLWVLGLAAVSGNPFVGMGLMLLLVLMTSLSILISLLGPGMILKKLRLKLPYFQEGLLAMSGFWMIMIGLAALGIIEHAHFRIGGGFVLMFW